MNKTTTALLVAALATAALTGCTDHSQKTATDVASSPTPQQLRAMVHDWLTGSGEQLIVHLRADLLTTETGGWQTDPFLAKEVADSISRTDVPNIEKYRPINDAQADLLLTEFIRTMKKAGIEMEGIGGDLSTPMNKVAVANSTDDLNQAQNLLDRFERRLTVIDQEADK